MVDEATDAADGTLGETLGAAFGGTGYPDGAGTEGA